MLGFPFAADRLVACTDNNVVLVTVLRELPAYLDHLDTVAQRKLEIGHMSFGSTHPEFDVVALLAFDVRFLLVFQFGQRQLELWPLPRLLPVFLPFVTKMLRMDVVIGTITFRYCLFKFRIL